MANGNLRRIVPAAISCRESACAAMGAPECRFDVSCRIAA